MLYCVALSKCMQCNTTPSGIQQKGEIMKNTRYLFDESQSPEGMISVSQIQSFMSCKKKWEYGYIEEITPRVDRAYLTIGKLCHKGMQVAMKCAWQDQQEYADLAPRWETWWLACGLEAIEEEYSRYIVSTPLLDEELPELDKMLFDAQGVFEQAFKEFQPWKYRVLSVVQNGKKAPALELHFKVPCSSTKGLHGYIDAILEDKETGFTWCVDYKFRKSLSPAEDEENNIQNAVYSYACAKMGIPITGTLTWQHLNTPAATPLLLKNGSVSRAKIKTTWDLYKDFCIANDVDPEPYREEMKEKLSGIEWFRANYEYRNPDTITNMWNECIVPAAKAIKAAKGPKANNYRSLYPWNCKMCQYRSLCQAELRGYDAVYIRQHDYTKRTHARDNKPIDESVVTML